MSTTWTVFWKNQGIKTVKRSRALKNYNARKDFASLQRIGVDRNTAEDIYQKSGAYGDPLFFSKLSRFFRRDPETVRTWINGSSKTDAFEKLFNIIDPNDLVGSKEKLTEIDVIFRFYNKGEGRHYEADYIGRGVINFDPKSFIFNLNRLDRDAKYHHYGTTQLGPDIIYCIQKDSLIGQPVYKFIKLSVQGKKLKIALSMDSTKEYNVGKRALEKWFNIFIDTPQSSKSLQKFEDFLVSGESENFILVGATYFDNNFKFTISDIYNRPLNVGLSHGYKRKVVGALKKTETVSLIRIFHKKKGLPKPISINLLSYKTAGIIGAISLMPIDKKLNAARRKQLNKDFKRDFGITLNEFVKYNDLDEIGIYKIFLEGTPQRIEQFDLRSKLAMSIYQELLTDNLLTITNATEEQTRFCVNRNCEERFKVLWERKFCSNCGQALINGKKLITQEVDESDVVNFIQSVYKNGAVTKLSNKLLKRNLFVAKIEKGENVAEFIPVNSYLKDHQIEVLKFRYPNLIIVTSKDNLEEYEREGLQAVRLYELIHNCKKGKSSLINDNLDQAAVQHLAHTRALCKVSVSRISNDNFYKTKNLISKYLGAELFEADCSAMLNYVFGNSVWLGAKYRGHSVPDGFTAFPLHDRKHGCFIWDAKYGEGNKLHMGNFVKNSAYIAAAKKNNTIRENGGLKGFVFISNKKFPKKFTTKYLSLTKGSRLKVSFLSAEQLQKITAQFRRYEKLIYNNENAKKIFMESMETIFFKIKKGAKCEIIDDTLVSTLLSVNVKLLNKLKAGKPLKI